MTLELLCCCPERRIMGAQGTDVVAFVRLIAFAGRHLNFFCRHCTIWITSSPCCRFFSISRNFILFVPATRRLTAKYLSHLQLATPPLCSCASRPKAPPPRLESLVVDTSFLSTGYEIAAHAHEQELVIACYVSDPRLQNQDLRQHDEHCTQQAATIHEAAPHLDNALPITDLVPRNLQSCLHLKLHKHVGAMLVSGRAAPL